MMTHRTMVGFLSIVFTIAAASPRFASACSLCSSPGDGDGDCRVSLDDYRDLNACLAGPGVTAPFECQCYDMNGDGHVDLRDAAHFQVEFSGAEMLAGCVLPVRADEPDTLAEGSSIWPVEPQASITDPAPSESVRAFSGEFYLHEEDLRIPGRGFDFVWGRNYRSRTGSTTSLGNSWSHSYDIHLQPLGGDIQIHGSDGRVDTFCSNSGGGWSNPESFSQIVQLPGGDYAMQFHDRSEARFVPHHIIPGRYDLRSISDLSGNTMTFDYDAAGRLTTIHDTLDEPTVPRAITLAYNPDGFISSVTDFTGREVRYAYYQNSDAGGDFGDLRSVTSPPVVGTPHGNDFPLGKTTVYTYSEGLPVPDLNHNLLTITDPKGQTYLVNTYAATLNPADYLFDRVVSQQLGDPGDVLSFHYAPLTSDASNNYAVVVGLINDRVGNVSECYYDYRNRICQLRQYTGRALPGVPTTLTANRPSGQLRSTDPAYFQSQYHYNDQSLLTRSVDPELSVKVCTYLGDEDFFAAQQKKAAPKKRVDKAGPRGGDQVEIVESYEYDPLLNHDTNQMTRLETGRGTVNTYAYDAQGRLTYWLDRSPSVVHDYAYNAFGQITLHRLPDNGSGHRREDVSVYYGPGPSYGYLQSQVVDETGLHLTSSFEYDGAGNVTRIVDPQGGDAKVHNNSLNQVVFDRSAEAQPSSGIRNERLYYYDANDKLTRVDVENRDASGALQPNTHFTTRYEYDTLNHVTRELAEVDALHDVVTEYVYDANENRVEVVSGEATNGNQPNNRVTTVYDERDLVFRETRAPGAVGASTSQYDYDRCGHITIAGRGLESGAPQITTYAYDGHNRLTLRGDNFGNSRAYHYDANDNVVSSLVSGELIDVLGSGANVRLSETAYAYDALDRLTLRGESFFDAAQMPLTDGVSTAQYTYSDASQLLSVTDDNGHTSACLYDTAQRTQACTDAKGNQVQMTYDSNSNVISELELELSDQGLPTQTFTTTYGYDGLNRMTLHGDNFGNSAQRRYDSRSLQTESIDALGNLVTYGYDGLMRLTVRGEYFTSTGMGGGVPVGTAITTQTWDDSSRLTSETNPNGYTTTYGYDALDRITISGYADGTHDNYGYDVFDNKTAHDDANGNHITYAYDGLNRLTLKSVTVAPGVSSDTTSESYAYDGLSRTVQATDDDSTVTYTYDSLSHPVQETLNGLSTSSSYDGVGNQVECVYPTGRTITNTYDAVNRVQAVHDGPATVVSYQYIGPNRAERYVRQNGSVTQCDYNGVTGIPNQPGDFGVKQVSSMTHSHPGLGTVIDARSYRWDPLYSKLGRLNQSNGIDHAYAYDSAGRLTYTLVNDTFGGGVVRDTPYTLDFAGNRNQVLGDNCPGVYVLEAVNPPADAQMNQYTATGCDSRTYDENGNLAQSTDLMGSSKSHLYDYKDRLVHSFDAATGVTTTFAYDAFDRRIRKMVLGTVPTTTEYYYGGDDRDFIGLRDYSPSLQYSVGDSVIYNQIIYQHVTGAGTDTTYVYGAAGEAVQMQRGPLNYYFHHDDLGNVVALTDDGGNLVESYDYQDYGQPEFYDASGMPRPFSVVRNPVLFRSMHYDDSTGLYDYGSRYLDPVAGRFINPPVVGDWDSAGDNATYAGNNPWTQGGSSNAGSKPMPRTEVVKKIWNYIGPNAKLKKGDRVSLVGFGSFSVSKRAARTGRNPQTGKEIKIAAKKVARFKAGAELAKTVHKHTAGGGNGGGGGGHGGCGGVSIMGNPPRTPPGSQAMVTNISQLYGGGGGGGCGGDLAIESRDTLKTYFETGKIPTQEDFVSGDTTGPFNPLHWQVLASGKVPRTVLKEYFQSGDKPTQQQFGILIDSMVNIIDDRDFIGLRTRINDLEAKLQAFGLLAFTVGGDPTLPVSGGDGPLSPVAKEKPIDVHAPRPTVSILK